MQKPKKSAIQQLQEQFLQMQEHLAEQDKQLKLQQFEIESKETSKPKPPPPPFEVEDLKSFDLDKLKMLLANQIIDAWTSSTIRGVNSRQQKVFDKLNSNLSQELLKEILLKLK